MKTERIEDIETKQEPVLYGTLLEALNAKSERTKQTLSQLSPAARARLNASSKGSTEDSLSASQKP